MADHGVRVTSEVKEEPVDETVTLRETKVNVDRRGANRPATEEDLRQAGRTVEAIETGEEPVVRKNARVIEEIILTREVNEREEKVHDTARKTEVHVEDVDPRNREGRKAS